MKNEQLKSREIFINENHNKFLLEKLNIFCTEIKQKLKKFNIEIEIPEEYLQKIVHDIYPDIPNNVTELNPISKENRLSCEEKGKIAVLIMKEKIKDLISYHVQLHNADFGTSLKESEQRFINHLNNFVENLKISPLHTKEIINLAWADAHM